MKFVKRLVILLLFSPSCFAQTKTEKIKASKSDIGLTMGELVIKLGIDTLKGWAIDEPPGVARGITAELSDSTIIYLHIDRKWFGGESYSISDLYSEKIIGIGLAYTNCEKEIFGKGFVLVVEVSNPYCTKKGD